MFKASNFNPNAGSSVSKIMNPGTHYGRIVQIKLETPPYKTDAYNVAITIEGIDRGDEFEGLAVDKTNPSLGHYRGQVATVSAGRYPFSDYTYNGKQIMRDDQIFRWVNNLAKQMGVLNKMNEAGVEASTIEEYVQAASKYLINPELWGHFTIGGQEYFKEGYDTPNYRLFFPKNEGVKFAFSALEDADRKPLNFINYNADVHIIKKPVTEPAESIDSFGLPGSAPTVNTGLSDLNL